MKVRVACPNTTCGKSYEIEPSQLGSAAECKKCGQKFKLEATKDTAAVAAAETRPQASPSTPSSAPPPDVPRKLGRFEIRSRLGAGGFGAVYLAYDPVLEREVALKVPRAAVLEKPEARARFLREPKAVARLQHPHIVPVFDAGTDGENYYIASAFIAGQTLQAFIATKRPGLKESAQIIHDIAEALQMPMFRIPAQFRSVRVREILSVPPLAVAPFDAGLAKQHQEAWAKHLGVPVETTNSIGMKLVLIPPGEFDMGSTEAEVTKFVEQAKEVSEQISWYIERLPAETPRHRVRITKPFYLGATEVTVGAFQQFVEETGYQTEGEKNGTGAAGFEAGGWVRKPEFTWRSPGFTPAGDHPVVAVSWNVAV